MEANFVFMNYLEEKVKWCRAGSDGSSETTWTQCAGAEQSETGEYVLSLLAEEDLTGATGEWRLFTLCWQRGRRVWLSVKARGGKAGGGKARLVYSMGWQGV